MRKRICKMTQSRWRRSPAGPFLGFALLFGLVILPSSAKGYEYIPGLRDYLKGSSDVIGGVSTAVTIGEAIGKYLGIFGSGETGPTNQEILDYMKAIEKYEDREQKISIMSEAFDKYDAINSTLWDLTQNGQLPDASVIYGWAMSNGGDPALSKSAVNIALNPGGISGTGQCTQIRQFQTPKLEKITGVKTTATTYDWRAGMGTALAAVATRLLAIKMYAPNFRYESGWAGSDFIPLIGCLRNHRDFIKPAVKPTPYCVSSNCGNSNNVLTCMENRDVDWKGLVTSATMPFPGCRNPATSTSEADFADLEETFASNTDYDRFGNVVFSLQKVIDSLYLYAHSPAQTFAPPSNLKDLTEEAGHIYFGADAQFCLVQDSSEKLMVVACSAATEDQYGTWEYDRGRGSIKNKKGKRCLAVQGRLPTATLGFADCTSTSVLNKDEQTWSWNPESGVIRNALGPVLAVTSAVGPVARAPVTAVPENSWRMNQQGWASSSSVCTNGGPAFCPKKGSAVWTQGEVTMPNMSGQVVSQRFPLDTVAFTYEQFFGPIDAAGPVASAGAIYPVNMYSYQPCGVNINYQGLPIGMVTSYGPIKLVSGTIFGETSIPFDAITPETLTRMLPPRIIDGSYIAPPAGSKPINFEMAFVNLQAYSQKLAKLPSSGHVLFPSPSQMMLTGAATSPGDPVVFYVDGAAFNNRYEIALEVSGSPTIVINVVNLPKDSKGRKAFRLSSTGFVSKQGNLHHPEDILWNFPDAEQVNLSYMGFIGSILAPFAEGWFLDGALRGTVIAWSLMSNFELYWAPFSNSQKLDALNFFYW